MTTTEEGKEAAERAKAANDLVMRLKERPVAKTTVAAGGSGGLKPPLKDLAETDIGKVAYYDYARHALVSVGLSWIQPKGK